MTALEPEPKHHSTRREQRRVFTTGHTGGDYRESTRMFFRPDRRVGVISLTNAYLGDGRWTVFRDIERRLFQEFS